MGTVKDIFFWIGLVTVGELVLVAGLWLFIPARYSQVCMSRGCDRPAMPGWAVCLKCHNTKTEPRTAGLEFLRDAS